MSRQLKDVVLERYLAEDLSSELRAKIEATLASSEADRARLEELRRDSVAFLAAHPPGPLMARVAEKQRRQFVWRLLAPALALAGVAAFTVHTVRRIPIDQKEIRLAVYSAEPDGVARPLAVATPGDAVRFLLAGRAMGYVAVMGRDSDGRVHVYVPKKGEAAERYDPKSPLLPDVSTLAPGSGREEIIGVFCPKPFELSRVVEAVEAGRPLTGLLPEGTVTALVPLEKSQASAAGKLGDAGLADHQPPASE